MNDDLGFTYRTTAKGAVHIARNGQPIVVLNGRTARDFLTKTEGKPTETVQRLCAKVTGNYKRGNESLAATVGTAKERGQGEAVAMTHGWSI